MMIRMQFIANGLRYTPYTEKVERQNSKTGYWEPHQEGIDITSFLKGVKEIKIVASGLAGKAVTKATGNDSNSILSNDMSLYDYEAIAASEVTKITFAQNATPPKTFVKRVSTILESSSSLTKVEGMKTTTKLSKVLSKNDKAFKQQEGNKKWQSLWESDSSDEGTKHGDDGPYSSDADTDWEIALGALLELKSADDPELTLAVLGKDAEGW